MMDRMRCLIPKLVWLVASVNPRNCSTMTKPSATHLNVFFLLLDFLSHLETGLTGSFVSLTFLVSLISFSVKGYFANS